MNILEAGLNRLRVKKLRAKVERQAKEITRLETSRLGLRRVNKRMREALWYITERCEAYAVCDEGECDQCDLLRELRGRAEEATK